MCFVVVGCTFDTKSRPKSEVERSIQTTKRHTFDFTTPPTRDALGMVPDSSVNSIDCEDCEPYRITIVMPSGERATFAADTIRATQPVDAPLGAAPDHFSIEVQRPASEVEALLDEYSQLFNIKPQDKQVAVRATADPSWELGNNIHFMNGLACDGYLQPSIAFLKSTKPDHVRVLGELDWGSGNCGAP